MGCCCQNAGRALASLVVTTTLLLSAGRVCAQAGSTVELADLESKFQAVAARVAPSVVALSISASANDSDDLLRTDDLNGEKLEFILQRTTRTVGTGFVLDPDGYILTNEHVVGGAGQIWVTTDDRKVYPAIVVGSDPRADLAVLKVPATGMTPVRFAPTDSVRRGMWTIALGNPFGLAGVGQMSMSVGIVSATERSLAKLSTQEQRYYSGLIQTTAEINPGNSGGPLFDIDGEVIGIATAVIMPQKSTNGIGFAMPITPDLLTRVRDLREGREIVYAYLGVNVTTATSQHRRAVSISDGSGVLVDAVEKGSPADGVLQPGDIIRRVNKQLICDSDQFIRAIGTASTTAASTLEVRRGGRDVELSVRCRRRDLPGVAVNRDNQRIRWRGMLLGPIPSHWTFRNGVRPQNGLMVLGIEPDSAPYAEGVRSGTVITSVAGKALRSITDLQQILNDTPAEQCRLTLAQPPQDLASAKD